MNQTIYRADKNIWIGLSGHRDGNWTWSDGSALGDWTTYHQYPWHPIDPNEHEDAVYCVRLKWDATKFVWADRACTNTFKYLCSGSYESGLLKNTSIDLYHDWPFLLDRKTTHCEQLIPGMDNIVVQTLSLNQLPSSSQQKVKIYLYFKEELLCKDFDMLHSLTDKCSRNNYYERCVVENASVSQTQKVCSYVCPIHIVDGKVGISFIANPLYVQGNIELCELEVAYTT